MRLTCVHTPTCGRDPPARERAPTRVRARARIPRTRTASSPRQPVLGSHARHGAPRARTPTRAVHPGCHRISAPHACPCPPPTPRPRPHTHTAPIPPPPIPAPTRVGSTQRPPAPHRPARRGPLPSLTLRAPIGSACPTPPPPRGVDLFIFFIFLARFCYFFPLPPKEPRGSAEPIGGKAAAARSPAAPPGPPTAPPVGKGETSP